MEALVATSSTDVFGAVARTLSQAGIVVRPAMGPVDIEVALHGVSPPEVTILELDERERTTVPALADLRRARETPGPLILLTRYAFRARTWAAIRVPVDPGELLHEVWRLLPVAAREARF